MLLTLMNTVSETATMVIIFSLRSGCCQTPSDMEAALTSQMTLFTPNPNRFTSSRHRDRNRDQVVCWVSWSLTLLTIHTCAEFVVVVKG